MASCAALSLGMSAPILNATARMPATAAQDTNSKNAEADAELHKAITKAGNDRAALARNLKDYLQRFPDAPRKANVYQALVEACQQLRDAACELEYAERLIAVQPDNSDMMMLAVTMLQERGDDASLTRAAGYVTRVLDRIEKASPADKPPQQSIAEWRGHQDRMRTGLYALRANVEKAQHNYDAAVKDLKLSYSLHPNGVAAIMLGEIAETRGDPNAAISEYLLAFVLPEEGDAGNVDRHEVRLKLGNVWRQVHGSEKGLGQEILATYDLSTRSPNLRRKPRKRIRRKICSAGTRTRRMFSTLSFAARTAAHWRSRRPEGKWSRSASGPPGAVRAEWSNRSSIKWPRATRAIPKLNSLRSTPTRTAPSCRPSSHVRNGTCQSPTRTVSMGC